MPNKYLGHRTKPKRLLECIFIADYTCTTSCLHMFNILFYWVISLIKIYIIIIHDHFLPQGLRPPV